jgi:hypothetical protein
MPLARSTRRVARFVPFALFVAAFVLTNHGLSGVSPAAQQPAPNKPAGTDVEVRCVDDSTMRLKLLDDRLDLVTKYGKLEIPVTDIRRIEFATRVPSEVTARVSTLISTMNHPDYETREKATAEVRDLKERAFPLLVKAIKNPDPEISRRAEESVKYLQGRIPAVQLEARECDVIYTDDSKITGKLVSPALRVQTLMFGDQTLKLTDVRTLRSLSGSLAEESVAATNAPANLMAFQNQFGKEATFNVTAPVANGQAMNVWGTDVYTLDSNLGAAAVHAGLVQSGQTGIIRVRVVASPAQFMGSVRNGVSSAPYGVYPTGAFEFVRK